jgi:hypothetical protein
MNQIIDGMHEANGSADAIYTTIPSIDLPIKVSLDTKKFGLLL